MGEGASAGIPAVGRAIGRAVGRALRGRVPAVAVTITCVAGVVLAVTGAVTGPSGPQFLAPGHWVFNSALQSAFHVDGATANVDARADVPGDPGSQVVQGDTSGYVVGGSDITEFGKATLTVVQTTSPPENAGSWVSLEVAGGPYLVYPESGNVVRLGDPAATVSVHGPIGDPVATPDGTVWLHATGTGLVCNLRKNADRLLCPTSAPEGHAGMLTVVADQPVFVDTSANTLQTLGDKGFGPPIALGVDVPDTVELVANDVSGRVAILDAAAHELHLVDPAGFDPAAKPAAPVSVPLPDGDYVAAASTGSTVALVDDRNDVLLTYDGEGRGKQSTPIPPESGSPRLTRGEDARVYVDGTEGKHVLVVGEDGVVGNAPIVAAPASSTGDPVPPPEEPKPPTSSSSSPVDPPPVIENPVVTAPVNTPIADPTTTTTQPPPPEPPAPPVPLPASPPGAPVGVAAAAGDGSATVTWGPAAENGAEITGYVVSWTSESGGSGSRTVGGGASSTAVSGLENWTPHTFTVRAVNSAGQGTAASADPVTPRTARRIVLARGSHECDPKYPPENCYKMRVELIGFAPNTRFKIIPHSTHPDYSNGGSGQTTDDDGYVTFEAFEYYGVGETVWVDVQTSDGPVESNHLFWGEA